MGVFILLPLVLALFFAAQKKKHSRKIYKDEIILRIIILKNPSEKVLEDH